MPSSEASDMFIKQLDFENANSYCQNFIRPIRRTKILQGKLNTCIGPTLSVIQEMAFAETLQLKGQLFEQYLKQIKRGNKSISYSCGQEGHFSRNCLDISTFG